MTSIIFATASRLMLSLLLLFSVFLLLRGHDEPGGGFIGGLVAATAIIVYALATSPRAGRSLLRIDPIRLIGLGLLVAAASGLVSLARSLPAFTGEWVTLAVGEFSLKIGTPLIFDIGVFLLVVGITLAVVLSLMEE